MGMYTEPRSKRLLDRTDQNTVVKWQLVVDIPVLNETHLGSLIFGLKSRFATHKSTRDIQ